MTSSFFARLVFGLGLAGSAALVFAQAGPANPMDQGKPGTPANQGLGTSNSNAVNPHPAGRRHAARRAAAAASAAASRPAARK